MILEFNNVEMLCSQSTDLVYCGGYVLTQMSIIPSTHPHLDWSDACLCGEHKCYLEPRMSNRSLFYGGAPKALTQEHHWDSKESQGEDRPIRRDPLTVSGFVIPVTTTVAPRS